VPKVLNVNSELLDSYICRSGLKIGYICETLGLSRNGFDKKKNGKTTFRASEVYVLCDLLNIAAEDRKKIFIE
jgi:hypothetical protein